MSFDRAVEPENLFHFDMVPLWRGEESCNELEGGELIQHNSTSGPIEFCSSLLHQSL